MLPPLTPSSALNSASRLLCSIISCRFTVSSNGSKSFSPRLGMTILGLIEEGPAPLLSDVLYWTRLVVSY